MLYSHYVVKYAIIRNIVRGLGAELAPVAAIVGGVLAGEVIKVVSVSEVILLVALLVSCS